MPAETKKRARRKAERPAEILDAAFEEFVKHGYSATRLEDVAALAGVTKGTIYFYFDTKERVFEEMVRHKSMEFLPRLGDYAATLTGSHTDRLRAMVVYAYAHIAENRASREVLRFLISEGGRFPDLVDRHYEEFVVPMMQHFKNVIDAGVAAGEFRDAPATEFVEIVMSPALLISLWSLLFGTRKRFDMDCFTEASTDLLLRGLIR
ncbi:TetR/AcrR family transcriptional regulator [Rhodopseudomonas palustris]|uniref:TetR/AcrR family transcriptional regulator n=1 Tax=Rhodopseudomonas palustris TaxID=1076 RepID=UPI002ACDEA57|nr:TetR/AcrR family transcriptional regulator [Rhodopseudomonas palustris]WQH00223.1 TetR/AcrR family transcriptional regulator [Rhodopseudomonas palustris]